MPVLKSPRSHGGFYWFCYGCGHGAGTEMSKDDAEASWKAHKEECNVAR